MNLEALRNNLPSVETLRSAVGMAPQIPKTHKAAMFKEKGGPLHVEEIETRSPGEGEVLVKVLACGICHSEVVAQQNMFGTGLYKLRLNRVVIID